MKYLIRDIILYNDKIIINYYFSDPLKKHNNSIESVKETEKQSKEAAPLSDFQSSYKGDNSPPTKRTSIFACPFCFSVLNKREFARCVASCRLRREPLRRKADAPLLRVNSPASLLHESLSLPPLANSTNTETNSGFVLFFKGYFGEGLVF